MPDPLPTRRGVVLGARGMVASAHPLASLAGARVLADGGNAHDAALAMAGMTSVVLPGMCGLGGDAFAVIHDARRREWRAYMGSGVGADGADIDFFRSRGLSALPIDGPLSVAVPGAVDCFRVVQEAGATRSLEELWAPAVSAARQGIAVVERMSREAAENADKLRRDAASHTVYLPGGAPPRVGSVLRQPELAESLQAVARDPRGFYQGAMAQRFVQALRDAGAPFSGEEWAAHHTVVETPLRAQYGGATLHTTLPPSPGYMVAQQAAALDGRLRVLPWLDAEAVHLMATTARRAFDDRRRLVGSDNDAWRTLVGRLSDGDTTCFVAADAAGNVVSFIHSVAFVWGSGFMVPGTGVLLNNRAGRGFYLDESHPNGLRPGKRPMHTLNCWVLADAQGNPLAAGATPGGDGQVQWNMQVISHLLDHGLDVQAAVEAPRFTVWPGSDADVVDMPQELRAEARIGADTLGVLRERGHNLRVVGDWEGGGGAQLLAVDREQGSFRGASDPRMDGCALGV